MPATRPIGKTVLDGDRNHSPTHHSMKRRLMNSHPSQGECANSTCAIREHSGGKHRRVRGLQAELRALLSPLRTPGFSSAQQRLGA
jgi:hypothetical protein